MTYRRSQSSSRAERSNHPVAHRSSARREIPRNGSTSRRRSSVHNDHRDDPLMPLMRLRSSSRPSSDRQRERERSPRRTDRSPDLRRRGSNHDRRSRDDHRRQQQQPSRRNSDAPRHEGRQHGSSRPRPSRRKTIDVPTDNRSYSRRSDNVTRSSFHGRSDRHSSSHKQRPYERAPSEEKLHRIMKQIKNSKHNLSRGSELTNHTESTGKLSSCSEMSSPKSPRGKDKVSGERGGPPLPFFEKVARKSSTGDGRGGCSLSTWDNKKPQQRPKYVEPKSDLTLPISCKYPPPPLNGRNTSSGSSQQIRENPPPPPPRKQQQRTHQREAIKEALKEAHCKSNAKNKADFPGLKQDSKSETNLNALNHLQQNSVSSRRGSLSRGGLKLPSPNSCDNVNAPTSQSIPRRSSFGHSVLSLNASQDMTLKEPSTRGANYNLSQSMGSWMSHSDVGLDLNNSNDQFPSSREKSYRRLSSMFSRRNSNLNTSSANNDHGSGPPSCPSPPPPQTEIRIFSAPSHPRSRLLNNERSRMSHVVNMPYTDPTYGDAGLYTGEVDVHKRPNGKGKMKYDNGIFYEGKWLDGKQDAKDCANRERMLSGFTSWKGQPKADGDKGCTVYGMEWIDLTGMSGKYTGAVDENNLPNGKGIMKYDFGLIAEGAWHKGVLNTGSQSGQSACGATVLPGGTVVPGSGGTVMGGGIPSGMSLVAGGGASVVSGLGMMSICGAPVGGRMIPNPMMNQYSVMNEGIMQPQMQSGMMQPQVQSQAPHGMPYAYNPMMMGKE